MKKRIYTLATMLLIAMLAISPVYAGGVSIKIGLGSITADLTAWGVGNGATASLSAKGIPYAWCQDPGNGKLVPGQNPSQASAKDGEDLSDSGKGKFTAFLEGQPTFTGWTAKDFGCPNNNWTGTPYFVQWTSLTITIINSKGEWFKQNYSCTTTYTGIDSNNTPANTFDDGTISCTPAR